MEKPPSVIKVESETNKEREKKSQAWKTVENIALGGMLSAAVLGGEAARELMQPQINSSEITDNIKDIRDNDKETVKEFISLRAGDKVYRAEIDSGISMNNFQESSFTPNGKGILNYADKMTAEVDNKDGSKMAVKFEIVPGEMGGMKITYQQIDAHGRVLSQRTSRLIPENPNIIEER